MTADGALVAAALTGAAVWSAWHGLGRARMQRVAPLQAASRPRLLWRQWRRAPAPTAHVHRDLLEIAAGVEAGLGFDAALSGLAHKPPWSQYLDRRRAGMPAAEAVSATLHPVWPELAAVLTVHWRYGGPLAEALLMLADDRSRQHLLAAEMRARSSEARATAWLLACTSPGLGLYLLVREPQLLSPLVSEPLGVAALLGAAALWVLGVALLRRLLPPAL